jgi:hypothetical protein
MWWYGLLPDVGKTRRVGRKEKKRFARRRVACKKTDEERREGRRGEFRSLPTGEF